MLALEDVTIRNNLVPGDLGYIIYLHGALYGKEYNFSIDAEMYIAAG
ncbi:MAG: GNAT family N-acetyltransferase, partial [Ignavibacteriales bacterium]|nr:GNAT family N-acetyltransferase [Ignavibacteriales bacterium]